VKRMPRRPRGVIVESFVHITSKGNRGACLYPNRADYLFFLQRLRMDAIAHGVSVHAYCLMPNHFHLLVEVADRPVSTFMHGLLQRHAQYINRLYRHHGHVFADRFWSKRCDYDFYFLAVLGYIHLNPIRAGLTRNVAQYPWSSHRAYIGREEAPWVNTRALELFSPDRGIAIGMFAQFVELQAFGLRHQRRLVG